VSLEAEVDLVLEQTLAFLMLTLVLILVVVVGLILLVHPVSLS
jgi:hypothetical protein